MCAKPLAADPSGGRRRPRLGNAASEVVSDHTGPFGQGWRELGLTRCKMKQHRDIMFAFCTNETMKDYLKIRTCP